MILARGAAALKDAHAAFATRGYTQGEGLVNFMRHMVEDLALRGQT